VSAPDPFEPLTVEQAARVAGVPAQEVQGRIDSGELLHERGTAGDVIVRRVDLADVWPAVLPRPRQAPTGARESAEPARTEELGETTAHLTRQKHAFEVRLASMQSANDALSTQVRDLQLQRSDLKDQCGDLRGRMTLIEKERQASTAGLLLAQGRLLELEAAGGAVQAYWWRRPTTWGFASVTLLVAAAWGWQWVQARAAREVAAGHASSLDVELEAQAGDRATWRAASSDLREELDAQRDAREAERGRLEEALAQRERALDEERRGSEEARARFTSRLEASLETNAAAQQVLLEQQAANEAALTDQVAASVEALEAERRAAAEERARFEASLAERERTSAGREAALREELSAARAATDGLAQALNAQAERDADRGRRLDAALAQLAVLEARHRREEGRRALVRVLRALWPRR